MDVYSTWNVDPSQILSRKELSTVLENLKVLAGGVALLIDRIPKEAKTAGIGRFSQPDLSLLIGVRARG